MIDAENLTKKFATEPREKFLATPNPDIHLDLCRGYDAVSLAGYP